ncbi:MAG: DUF2784 domain-containing protein [Alphaproteobacteria bacterium]|nr:DUF2784 domain-containing protein [Alphaproteobacteria bacterium]
MSLADAILVAHTLYILGVVLPVFLIPLGALRGWAWVRNPWFRYTHLAMIGFVVAQSLLGQMCPLTIWENDLRLAAGGEGYGESFIAYYLHKVVFYRLPGWVFTVGYCAFAALVATLWIWVRPGKPHLKKHFVTSPP